MSKKVIHINPPPKDGKCECCHKSIKELKPFGKAGDPLVGDFNGALLVKSFRTMAMPITDEKYIELEKKHSKKKNYDEFEKNLVKIFGAKKTDDLMFRDQLANTIEASWECRDCIILDNNDYFKKRRKSE